MGFVIKGDKLPISTRINSTSYGLFLCIMLFGDQGSEGMVLNQITQASSTVYDLSDFSFSMWEEANSELSLCFLDQIMKVEEGMTLDV